MATLILKTGCFAAVLLAFNPGSLFYARVNSTDVPTLSPFGPGPPGPPLSPGIPCRPGVPAGPAGPGGPAAPWNQRTHGEPPEGNGVHFVKSRTDRAESPFLLRDQGGQFHLSVPRAPRLLEVLVHPGLPNHPGVGMQKSSVSQPKTNSKQKHPKLYYLDVDHWGTYIFEQLGSAGSYKRHLFDQCSERWKRRHRVTEGTSMSGLMSYIGHSYCFIHGAFFFFF